MDAAIEGHIDTVRLLLDRGADIDAKADDVRAIASLSALVERQWWRATGGEERAGKDEGDIRVVCVRTCIPDPPLFIL